MSHETRDSRQPVSSSAQGACHFIWPLSKSPTTPDEMNTSYGPRIDADRWDFHDGIDLPAAVGTPVHAMADGMVQRAGPVELQMDRGLVIHPLAFLAGNEVVAAACLRKIRNDEYIAGVLIRSADGFFRERIDVNEGEIFRDGQVRWELELLRSRDQANDRRIATEQQRGGPHQRRHHERRARCRLRGDFA